MVTDHRATTRTKVLARARTDDRSDMRGLGVIGGVIAGAMALWLATGPAKAEDVIKATGYSTFGEFKYKPGFTHLDYVNPDAPKGGSISFAAEGTFDSMNPFTRKGRAGALSTIGYESLMAGTADEVSAYYCLICESLEYPPTEDWVIFYLRKDVKFSDGTPLTAHDVAFSHHLLLEQGLPSYAAGVGRTIPKAEALDDYTVKFYFNPDEPKKDLILQAGGTTIWSKAWFDKTGARLDESRMEISPGSGPYVLDHYDVNKRIVYKRNPDYWGKDHPLMQGRSNFDEIRVEYFADSSAAFEAFKAGEFTFRQENSSIQWATAYDFPSLSAGDVVKAELPNGNLPAATGFVFNLRREKFQDIRVRQAMALMFNFTWTNDTLQYGLFQQRESFWQGSKLQATGVPEGRELEYLESVKDLIDPAILTEPVTVPHTSGSRQLDRKNLRAASALLDEAGWAVGSDGVRRNAAGEPLTLEFLTTNPTFDRIINPYIENLKTLGVDAVMSRVDPSQYTNRERAHDWDMIYDGYSTYLEEGTGMVQQFGTEGLGDVFNPSGYSSPEIDKLIAEMLVAKTYEDMAASVRAMDRIMRAEIFIIPTWYLGKYWVAYYDQYEHPDPLPPYLLGQLDFWWYNAEKAEKLKAANVLR